MPFARCSISAYTHCLNEARNASDINGECVKLEFLAANFTTPAWQELRNPSSKLSQFLLTNFPSEDGDGIDYTCLMVMGLLHCHDAAKPKKKATQFYHLLQDGGPEKFDFITS